MNFRTSLAALAVLAAATSASAQETRGPGIEVRELGAVDPFQVGISEALGETVWSSGEARVTAAVLERLPNSQGPGWQSALAARLAARALLSAGPPPENAADSFALAALRADRALAAAGARPAFLLLERTPRLGQSPALSKVHAEAGFALGETGAACRTAEQLLEGRDQAYWLRARAACSALAGNIAAAELTAELARSVEPAPVFEALFDAYTLGGDLPGDALPVSGLQLALAHAIAPERTIRVGETAPAWLAEAAESFGPPIELPELLSEALEAAMAMEGAERATVLGALAGQDLDRAIAAEALAVRLGEAAAEGEFVEVARAYGDEIATLPITADTLAYAKRFVLAAILDGDLETARIWREAVMDGPPRPEAEPVGELPDLSAPGMEAGPSGLTPPASAKPAFEVEAWTPPPAETLVTIDFALAIAEDAITGPAFEALLAARIETGDPRRLAEAAGLSVLGAPAPAALRLALFEAHEDISANGEDGSREETTNGTDDREPASGGDKSALAAPGFLSARAGALAETQLQAAGLIEAADAGPEAFLLAARMLAEAGLSREARRFILESVAEGAM